MFTTVIVDVDSPHIRMDSKNIVSGLNENRRALLLTYVNEFKAVKNELLVELK
jgi:hypothetical protein